MNYSAKLLILYFFCLLFYGCDSPTAYYSWDRKFYHNVDLYVPQEGFVQSITCEKNEIKVQKDYEDFADFILKIQNIFGYSNLCEAEAEWFYGILSQEIRISDQYSIPQRAGHPLPAQPICYSERVLIRKQSKEVYLICYPIFGEQMIKYFYQEIFLTGSGFQIQSLEIWQTFLRNPYTLGFGQSL